MAGKKIGFFERLSVMSKDALITSAIPIEARLQFIALSPEAINKAISFAFNAIISTQYDNYTKNIALGKTPEEAKVLAVADLPMQEIAFQLMQIRSANMDGSVISGTPLSLLLMTVQEAIALDLPVKPESLPADPYILLTIPPGEPGADGADGAAGADGADGAAGADGADGADGAPGECPDCSNPPPGPQPTGPGPQPTGPGGGGDDGTEPGGGVITNPTGTPGAGDTQTCGEPVQIYQKQMSGLRSWIFAPSQLLYTDFDYPNVNLRPAIDAVAANTFPDYDPARLKGATMLLDMAYLVTESVPTPGSGGSFSDIEYTPDNTIPRLYSDTARADLLGQFGAGDSTEFSIPIRINGDEHSAGITVGLTNFSSIDIDVSGQKDVYVDGSVVPLPLVAQVLLDFLSGRTSARIFVSCLIYTNVLCEELDGNLDYLPLPSVVGLPGNFDGEDPHNAGRYDNWGDFYSWVGTAGMYRHANSRRAIVRVYGFKSNTDYGLRAECYGGPVTGFNWFIQLTNFEDPGGVINQPDFNLSADAAGPIVEWPHLNTGPNVNPCGLYAVCIYGPEWLNQVEVYEV